MRALLFPQHGDEETVGAVLGRGEEERGFGPIGGLGSIATNGGLPLLLVRNDLVVRVARQEGVDLPGVFFRQHRAGDIGETAAGLDQGRALLKARGVPFAERTVNSAADQEKLKQAGSLGRLPLLQVGHTSLVGFEEGNWNAALSAAAYPQQNMLPKNYTYAKAEPAAPPPPAPPSAETLARANAAKAAAELPLKKPPPLNAPPNFQF